MAGKKQFKLRFFQFLSLLLFCALLKLFFAVLLIPYYRGFVYHWDAVIYLLIDCFVAIAIVKRVNKEIDRRTGLSASLPKYLLLFAISGFLFTTVVTMGTIAAEHFIFGKRLTPYHYLLYWLCYLFLYCTIGNGYIAYLYLT